MPTNYVSFLDQAKHFNSNKGFSILVLNIVDLNSRIDELKCILNSRVFDIIVLNETKSMKKLQTVSLLIDAIITLDVIVKQVKVVS